MTPKEKAQELVTRLSFKCRECDYEENAKYAALIAVDEILSELAYTQNYVEDTMNKIKIYVSYWQEVKQEIENL